ncbi:hypothetical protein GUITHDRAFT_149408, partial [Guillardia theta CCMP2712]
MSGPAGQQDLTEESHKHSGKTKCTAALKQLYLILSVDNPPVIKLVNALHRAPPAREAILAALSRRMIQIHESKRECPGMDKLCNLVEVSEDWRKLLFEWSLDLIVKIESEDEAKDSYARLNLQERYATRASQSVPVALASLVSACMKTRDQKSGLVRQLVPMLRNAKSSGTSNVDMDVWNLLKLAKCVTGDHVHPSLVKEDEFHTDKIDWLLVYLGRNQPLLIFSWLIAALLAQEDDDKKQEEQEEQEEQEKEKEKEKKKEGTRSSRARCVPKGEWSSRAAARVIDALCQLRRETAVAVLQQVFDYMRTPAKDQQGVSIRQVLRLVIECPRLRLTFPLSQMWEIFAAGGERMEAEGEGEEEEVLSVSSYAASIFLQRAELIRSKDVCSFLEMLTATEMFKKSEARDKAEDSNRTQRSADGTRSENFQPSSAFLKLLHSYHVCILKTAEVAISSRMVDEEMRFSSEQDKEISASIRDGCAIVVRSLSSRVRSMALRCCRAIEHPLKHVWEEEEDRELVTSWLQLCSIQEGLEIGSVALAVLLCGEGDGGGGAGCDEFGQELLRRLHETLRILDPHVLILAAELILVPPEAGKEEEAEEEETIFAGRPSQSYEDVIEATNMVCELLSLQDLDKEEEEEEERRRGDKEDGQAPPPLPSPRDGSKMELALLTRMWNAAIARAGKLQVTADRKYLEEEEEEEGKKELKEKEEGKEEAGRNEGEKYSRAMALPEAKCISALCRLLRGIIAEVLARSQHNRPPDLWVLLLRFSTDSCSLLEACINCEEKALMRYCSHQCQQGKEETLPSSSSSSSSSCSSTRAELELWGLAVEGIKRLLLALARRSEQLQSSSSGFEFACSEISSWLMRKLVECGWRSTRETEGGGAGGGGAGGSMFMAAGRMEAGRKLLGRVVVGMEGSEGSLVEQNRSLYISVEGLAGRKRRRVVDAGRGGERTRKSCMLGTGRSSHSDMAANVDGPTLHILDLLASCFHKSP